MSPKAYPSLSSTGPKPLMKTKSPARTADEYGPRGEGAPLCRIRSILMDDYLSVFLRRGGRRCEPPPVPPPAGLVMRLRAGARLGFAGGGLGSNMVGWPSTYG